MARTKSALVLHLHGPHHRGAPNLIRTPPISQAPVTRPQNEELLQTRLHQAIEPLLQLSCPAPLPLGISQQLTNTASALAPANLGCNFKPKLFATEIKGSDSPC